MSWMSKQTNVRNLSLLLGLVYVGVIGFDSWTISLQTTLFHTAFFVLLWSLSLSRRVRLSLYHKCLFFLGIGLSMYLSITSNSLVAQISYFVVWLLTSLTAFLAFESTTPDTPISYLKSFGQYGKYVVVQGFSLKFLREFFSLPLNWWQHLRLKRIPRDTAYGLLIAIPLLVIFHLLFIKINADYAQFMLFINKAIVWIYHAIKYIFNIEVIVKLIRALVMAYIFNTFLQVERTKQVDEEMIAHWPAVIFKIVLASVSALFLVFSVFQSKLLLLDVFHLGFQEISQYVQHGFMELLGVTLVGYLLSVFVLHHTQMNETGQRVSTRALLAFFCAELAIVTVFMFHKLYALQAVFGLKDQRILATGAILLIFLTFIWLFLRIIGKLSAPQIFRRQIMCLAGLMFLLNVINVDAFVSRYHSIRYGVEGGQQKDYSYLLGNSYDNVPEWIALMDEAQEVGIAAPSESYYWGSYRASRVDFFGQKYNPICESAIDAPVSYLQEHYEGLQRKYSGFGRKTPLTTLTTINFHEYQAYQFLRENETKTNAFVTYAKSRCSALPRSPFDEVMVPTEQMNIPALIESAKDRPVPAQFSHYQRWALSLDSMIIEMNGWPYDSLSLLPPGKPEPTMADLRQALKDSWGVTDRESALDQLNWLANTGHSSQYSGATESDLIYAWDYGRFVLVAKASYSVGYLSDREALRLIEEIGKRTLAKFRSWREFGDNYVVGRLWWAGERAPIMLTETNQLYTTLLRPDGQWSKIPWEWSGTDEGQGK